MTITKDTIIGDILNIAPQTAPLFMGIGMHCLGCPASRGETVEQACMVHGAEQSAPLFYSLNNRGGNSVEIYGFDGEPPEERQYRRSAAGIYGGEPGHGDRAGYDLAL